MSHHGLYRVATIKCGKQEIQRQVLGVLKRDLIAALELDTNGKIVAVFPATPTRNPCVPRPLIAGNELDQFTITTNQKMGGNPQTLNLGKIRMRRWVETIGK